MNEANLPDSRRVAMYWDFENLHASLCDAKLGDGSYAKPDVRFKLQEPLVNVQAVIELAASYGPLAINKAYCNWQYYSRYREALLQGAVELVQLFPPGGSAKNGADIKLCLDAVEDLARFPHIGTVLIVGGDSDFMPAAQKIKATGRTLVGVGTKRSTNRHWAKSCHDFRYYESVVGEELKAESTHEGGLQTIEPVAPSSHDEANAMIARAITLLAEASGDPWVNKANIFPMVKRLDATFDWREFKFGSFSSMLKAIEGKSIQTRKGEFDQQVRVLNVLPTEP